MSHCIGKLETLEALQFIYERNLRKDFPQLYNSKKMYVVLLPIGKKFFRMINNNKKTNFEQPSDWILLFLQKIT